MPASRPAPVALVVCGALAADVRRVLAERGWQADLYGVPAAYHMRPASIVAAVDEHLERIRDHYRKVIVVYGDCGTAGELDRVLERHRAERPAGEHCYEIFSWFGIGRRSWSARWGSAALHRSRRSSSPASPR
jgi:hypothetical protein